jgi:recombination protein RecA
MDEALRKKIELFVASTNKIDGENSVIFGNAARQKVDVISTRSLKIDQALGIGGIPKGRIVELYGGESSAKSSLALQVVAEAQSRGGAALYIDAENALDPVYATNLGVNLDEITFAQPDTAEKSLTLAKNGLECGAFDVVVIDSIAALVPRAMLEGDIGDAHVGVMARLMSQNLSKLANSAARTNTALLCINQTRSKIGVCFQYDTMVLMADGSVQKIGKIVNQKIKADVMTFDPITREVKTAPIVGWHRNGRAESFLHIETNRPWGSNGASGFKCTHDHQIFTPSGFKRARDLSVGDEVMSVSQLKLSDIQMQVAIGSVLGDGSLRATKSGRANLRILHGPDQVDYCKWKESIFSNLSISHSARKQGGWCFETESIWDLEKLRKESYVGGSRRLPSLDGFTHLSLAIWCMDDGSYAGTKTNRGKGKFSLACKWLSDEEKLMVADKIESMGIPRPSIGSRVLMWYGESCYELQKSLAKYWHPSMSYKLHPSLHGMFLPLENVFSPAIDVLVPTRVNKISTVKGLRSMEMFDLTVADTHTYMVSGVCVHNSYGDPTTTSGGAALRFYASIRVQMTRATLNKSGEEVLGNTVKVKVVKNKLAAPFKECEPEIIYGEGFSLEREILDFGEDAGLLEKSGAWYKINGNRIQGREEARQFLLANPEIAKDLLAKIRESLGI